ncbi:Thioredoxin-like fold domain-containing protein [Plasmodiophora brassicae]
MLLIVGAVVVLACVRTAEGQAPIPARPDGWAVGPPGAPVVVDMFLDLMCPDCRADDPIITQLARHYGDRVRIVYHVFPLPYHRNAFAMAQLAHYIGNRLNTTGFLKWKTGAFAVQDSFGNQATSGLSQDDVNSRLADVVAQHVGIDKESALAALKDGQFDWATRVSWKYACSRAVSGTPTYLVNGVNAFSNEQRTLDAWIALIDGLLLGSGHKSLSGDNERTTASS